MDENIKHLGTNFIGILKAVIRDVVSEREIGKKQTKEHRIGDKWTPEEEHQLQKEYAIAIEIIALLHKRNTGGIYSRLQLLGLLGHQDC